MTHLSLRSRVLPFVYPASGLVVGLFITFTQQHELALGLWGYLVVAAASVISDITQPAIIQRIGLVAQVIVIAAVSALVTTLWAPTVPLVVALVVTISLLQWMRVRQTASSWAPLQYLALPAALVLLSTNTIAVVGAIGAWAIIMGVFDSLAHIDSLRTRTKENTHVEAR